MFERQKANDLHHCPTCQSTLIETRAGLRCADASCVETGRFFAYGPLLVRLPDVPSTGAPQLPWERPRAA